MQSQGTRIYIVGMPGVGKTTLGRKLAKLIHYSFLDLDEYIQHTSGKTVQQIFTESGEEGFRKIEQACLHQTLNMHQTVVATGGGTAAWHDNMNWMNAHGYTIYICADEKFIAEHLLQATEQQRPLLKNMSTNELLEWVSHTLNHREPYYEVAKLKWKAPLKSLKSLVNTDILPIIE